MNAKAAKDMASVCETALKLALVCLVLGSALAAEVTTQEGERPLHPPSFGSFYSGPYHGPPRYEHSPPPPHRLSSSFGSFYSGPYRGPPRYETPPPPHHLGSSLGSFYSGPYRGPPRYENPPPPHA